MRKISIVLVMLVGLLQSVCFASIDKSAVDNHTKITSSYVTEYEVAEGNDNPKRYLTVHLDKYRFGNNDTCSFSVTATSFDGKNKNLGVVLSKSEPFTINYKKNGVNYSFCLNNVEAAGNYFIGYSIDKNTLKPALDAEKVSLVFSVPGRKEQRTFEIPKEIVAEWSEVINADLKKIRKELI